MSYLTTALSTGSRVFGTKPMATVSALTTVVVGADMVNDWWFGGQEKGGLADFFGKLLTGSSTQEKLPSDPMSTKRGRLIGTFAGMMHDAAVPIIGRKLPILAVPLMGWQGYQAYREFRYGDFDGPFDMINGINNLSNIALLASGSKTASLFHRRIKLANKLPTTHNPELCRKLLKNVDEQIVGNIRHNFGFLEPVIKGLKSLESAA